MIILIVVLLIFALAGGLVVNPLLFLLALVAILVFAADHRSGRLP